MAYSFIGIAALEIAPKTKYSSAASAIEYDQNLLVDLVIFLLDDIAPHVVSLPAWEVWVVLFNAALSQQTPRT